MEYKLIESILTIEKPEISVVIPGIRQSNWDGVYDSIVKSTNRSFELIIVGPTPLTSYLQDKKNVKYIKDYGSPVRAATIGTMLCEGKLIMFSADDSMFIENALDDNINTLYAMGPDQHKNVVVAKYFEGKNYSGIDPTGDDYRIHMDDNYYKLCNAYPKSVHIPVDWWIFNAAIIYREFLERLGGLDCAFQSCAIAQADLAARAQHAGANVIMSQFPLCNCDFAQGDSDPVHSSYYQDDVPIYTTYYSQPLDLHPICIDIFNWKKSSIVWKKRFK